MNRLHISTHEDMFSSELISVAKTYGLKTIGQLQNFLAKLMPSTRVYYWIDGEYKYRRAAMLNNALLSCTGTKG